MNKSFLIVGAGLSGAVIARCLADNGHKVTVIDKRDHIGGNCYDYLNDENILVHKYGPHLFHTSNLEVVDWLSRFTEWVPYKHKVKAKLKDSSLVTLPVNAETARIVGKENVIDIFFRPYTKKMWGLDIEQLDSSILKRVPIREDDNEFYFPNDNFQAMPKYGYTKLFEEILDHENIVIHLKTNLKEFDHSTFDHIFNSMPIDEYFDWCYGRLPYRSMKFHTSTVQVPNLFPVATVNFTHDGPCTRVTEWKNIPNARTFTPSEYVTTITVEEPCEGTEFNEPYYPVKDIRGMNRAKFESYQKIVPSNMTFIGRCGTYSYIDMDKAVALALEIVKKF